VDIITIDNGKLCIEVCVASFCTELLKLLVDLDDILCINSIEAYWFWAPWGKGPLEWDKFSTHTIWPSATKIGLIIHVKCGRNLWGLLPLPNSRLHPFEAELPVEGSYGLTVPMLGRADFNWLIMPPLVKDGSPSTPKFLGTPLPTPVPFDGKWRNLTR